MKKDKESPSRPLKILIVEDEFVTLDMLSDSLKNMGYTVAGDAMSIDEAKEVLASTPVDFAILDINVRGEGKGIELGHFINENYNIPFIYLTAYSDPATIESATATSPYGYLIKPFTQADIHAAIKVAAARQSKMGDDDIYLKDQNNFVRLKPSDIIYIEACRNYIEVNTPQGKHVIRSTMKEIQIRLSEKLFFKPHRSFLVNANYVRGYKDGNLTVGQAKIPVSSNGLKKVTQLFAHR